MRGKMFLEKAAEIEGAGEDFIRGSHWQQAIGVDQFKTDGNLLGSGLNHFGQKETREVVADDNTGLCRQSCDQPAPRILLRFDVRVVRHRFFTKSGRIINHAVDQESMEPVISPAIITA